MPAFPGTGKLPHAAILWTAIPDQHDEFGEVKVTSEPVQISCWIKLDSEQTKAGHMDSTSSDTAIDIDLQVDRRIPNGSRMWIGTLRDWNLGNRVGPILYVRHYDQKTDAVKGGVVSRMVKLERFRLKL